MEIRRLPDEVVGESCPGGPDQPTRVYKTPCSATMYSRATSTSLGLSIDTESDSHTVIAGTPAKVEEDSDGHFVVLSIEWKDGKRLFARFFRKDLKLGKL